MEKLDQYSAIDENGNVVPYDDVFPVEPCEDEELSPEDLESCLDSWSETCDVPEDLEIPEPTETVEAPALPESKETSAEPAPQYADFWQSCLDICNACGKYQRTKKLAQNYDHEETRHRVQHVVNNPKYWDGINGVKVSRDDRRAKVVKVVGQHNAFCRAYHVDELDPDQVIAKLNDGAIIDRYRGCFETCLKRNFEPFAFVELPARRFRQKH